MPEWRAAAGADAQRRGRLPDHFPPIVLLRSTAMAVVAAAHRLLTP
jgi:hypothetical protein